MSESSFEKAIRNTEEHNFSMAAKELHKMYVEFQNAGFEKDEAMKMMSIFMQVGLKQNSNPNLGEEDRDE